MTAKNFDSSLKMLLKHEGGFVNHPKDPGGMTNLGVTKKAWEEYQGRKVTEQEMRDLTPHSVQLFYKTRYWDEVRANELPSGVDHCVFDACVNSGAVRAAKILQNVVGADVDGKIGPKTLAKVSGRDAGQVIRDFCDERLRFLKSLSTWPTFGKGWERRVVSVCTESLILAGLHK